MDLAIISYFKVLPTDPRYRNLNLAQKLILLSTIGDHYEFIGDLIKMGTSRIDGLLGVEQQDDTYTHHNTFFEKQSNLGRTLGVPISPDIMKKEIEHFYKEQDIPTINASSPTTDSDDVLG